MNSSRFDKLTKQIGLVLISSSLCLGGCAGHCDDERRGEQEIPGQPRPADCRGGGGGHGHGGAPIGSRTGVFVHGAGGGVPSAPAVGSARGGFGATGHTAAVGG